MKGKKALIIFCGTVRDSNTRRSRQDHEGKPEDGLPVDCRQKITGSQDWPQDIPCFRKRPH